MELKKLIEQGNALFEKIDRRDAHLSNQYALQDLDETLELVQELAALGEKIKIVTNPKTIEEVHINELKRLCTKGADILGSEVSPHISTPQEVIERFSVTTGDLDKIKDWLLQNRQPIIKANMYLYKNMLQLKNLR